MQEINNSRKFIAFFMVLIFSMTVYHNIHFDNIFSYYEHNGEKEYVLEEDGWIVDLESNYEMKSQFEAMFSELEQKDYPSNGLILVKNSTIVYEEYGNNFQYNTEFNTYSVTKSFTSALVGIALDKGFIDNIDDTVWKYFPNRTFENDSPEKQKVTIKHILMMTSGFDYGVDPTLAPAVQGSRADYVLNRPVIYEPGTTWIYDSQAPSILIKIIELQSNMSLIDFATEYLFKPLGIYDVLWTEDESDLAFGGFGLYLTNREMAKFGQLYLQNGLWNNTQIISEAWVTESTTESMDPDIKFIYDVRPESSYGYLWWVYDGYYVASGLHGQRIFVNSEYNYVLIFTSLDVTQSGANALHDLIVKGEMTEWRKPMNEFYLRSLPFFIMLLFVFSTINFLLLKYGPNKEIVKSKKTSELVTTSFLSSFYLNSIGYLVILSIIFSVLDIFFGTPRGFMLFPKFQLLTWATTILFLISAVIFERELLQNRHTFQTPLKWTIPKVIVFKSSILFVFFSIYLKMVAEYSI